ncbi:hypothetical protein GCM10027418_32270 [Mariniluteicoccus endophyticus]
MNAHDAIVASAIVGTARHPLDAAVLPEPLRPRTGATAPEVALDAATLHLVAARASAGVATGEVVTPDLPAETRPLPPRGWVSAFRQALGANRHEVVGEALGSLAEHGMRVPVEIVPELLDLTLRHRSLHDPAGAVLGEAGAWLRAQREVWSATDDGVTHGGDEVWELGTLARRAAWLECRRADDPAAARAALEAVWPKENAEGRVRLLRALRTGLGPDDFPFLEACLDDRSKVVSETARELQALRTDSPLAGRTAVRVAAAAKRGMLRRLSIDPRLVEVDARDGGPADPKPSAVLAWLAGTLPLSLWPALVGKSAVELVGRDVHDGLTLDEGLARVALREGDGDVAAALLGRDLGTLTPRLLAVASPEAQAGHLRSLLKKDPDSVPELLVALDRWPDGILEPLLDWLSRTTQGRQREVVVAAATRVDPHGRVDVAGRLRDLGREVPALRNATSTSAMTLDLRRALTIAQPTDPDPADVDQARSRP